MTSAPSSRDVVVVGASAGGIRATCQLVGGLPRDLPATVLVVQHLSPASPRHLVTMLQRCTQLPVQWAAHGDPLDRARVIVAPPDLHLLVDGDRVLLSDAPRENYARPSIDRLFRSAAAHARSRTVGVLLTGTLHDGVAGLAAIREVGGAILVQDPEEAEYAQLPRNAIAALAIDRALPLERIALSIVELSRTPATHAPNPDPTRAISSHRSIGRTPSSRTRGTRTQRPRAPAGRGP